MDLDYEQRLIDEVIYLHSLWHQGPPTRPPLGQPIPSRLLHYTNNPTQFKKPANRDARKNSSTKQLQESQNPIQWPSPAPLAPGKEWPSNPTFQNSSQWPSRAPRKEWSCNPTSDSSQATTSGWRTTWPESNSQTLLPSPIGKSEVAANDAQFKALQMAKKFFKSGDDDDGEGDSEDEDDDSLEEEECRFFFKVFMEDWELKEYYEKNYHDGQFSCLVCGVLGKKLAGKKFKDCVALVQHSISISKTKKRRAHRAFGQAICKVLGWDLGRLPAIAAELSEMREKSLQNSGQSEVEDQDKRKEQEKVCEGNDGGSVILENSPVEASNLGQANVGEGTNNGSASLETEEGPYVSYVEEVPQKECVRTGILPTDNESVDSKNSFTGAETSRSSEVFCQTVGEIVENQEAGLVTDG